MDRPGPWALRRSDAEPMIRSATVYDSARRRARPIEELQDLVANGALVHALVTRDLKIRYKRSVLGVLWTLVNPLAMVIILSLAFTRVFVRDAPDYPFFLIPGLLLWNFISQTTMTVAREISIGVDMWRRVRVPKSALVVATTLNGLINVLLALVPLLLVLFVMGRPLGLAVFSLPVTILLAALFVLGASLVLATIAVYFPDIADIYSIMLPALMFTAPIVYPQSVSLPAVTPLLQLNPVTLFVEAFRAPLYGNVTPSPASVVAMTIVALITLAVGWIVFTRSIDDVLYQR